eukprot:CCRYP_003009-RA/>CCRYP_003009-RA protein AED:0.07 eAED:0.07 QI:257/1/1/1/0.5/0.33/3/178/393
MEYHTLLNKANYTKFSNHSTDNLDSNELLITMEEEAPTEFSKTEEQPISAINKEQPIVNLNRDIKNGKRFVIALIAFTSITVVNWFIPRHQWPWKYLILEKTQAQTLSLPAQLQQYYNLRVAQLSLERPVMSTFFEPVEGGCCGMTEQGHLNLLKAWEEAWQTWGWNTRVLTEEDARKHPKFEALESQLSQLDMNGYNHRCFWRWLAMANNKDINAGWMSDYDTFPLLLTGEVGKELMSMDGFKSWSFHVPTLIHADRSSWDRIIDLMMSVISPDLDVEMLTDMLVLEYLYKNLSEDEMHITVWENFMYEGAYIYKQVEGKEGLQIDCEGANLALAAHISHHDTRKSIVNGVFPKIEGMKAGDVSEGTERRADAAKIMMKDYREQCILNPTSS